MPVEPPDGRNVGGTPPSAPIHDLGYRGWRGQMIPDAMRWWVITATGVRMAWQNMWLRRMLFFAWMPAGAFGIPFFFYEQAVKYPQWTRATDEVLESFGGDELADVFRAAPAESRHLVWTWLLKNFFQWPQATLMILLIGTVAPPLISRDLRSRAYLLYFSRPITRGEYVLGKSGTVWCYLLLITTAPSLALYLFGVLLSPTLGVVIDTWDIPLRIVGASIVLIVPTTAVALLFSSMTTESRYAGFAWIALWVFGEVAWMTAYATTGGMSDWTGVSLFRMLREVQSWVFGLRTELADVFPYLIVLTAITMLSVSLLFRRVAAPMRI